MICLFSLILKDSCSLNITGESESLKRGKASLIIDAKLGTDLDISLLKNFDLELVNVQ